MNKKVLYGLVFCALFFALVIPDMINPSKGIIFTLEEWVGLFLLLIAIILSHKFVARTINKLNHSYPWNPAFKQRILINLLLIITGTSILSLAVYLPTSYYARNYGVPQFYQKVLDKKAEINASNNALEKSRKGKKSIWSFSDFIKRVIESIFLGIVLIFVVEEVYAYLSIQSQKKLELQMLISEQAQLKASVLKKQLDPHFMFNTLNVLSGLVYQDADKSAQFIKELSNVYRYVLVQSEELVSTIEQEFEFLESYMHLIKIRFDNKIPTHVNVPSDRKDWLIPSMTLELLAENAIKHNRIEKESPLHLSFEIKNDKLIVKNNLQPRSNYTESIGVGIKNLKRRLDLLGVKGYNFSIVENEFVAIVPLINPENV